MQIDGGVDQLKNESAVIAGLQANITEPGFYFAPGMNMKNATEEAQAEWARKYEAGPTAIIVYNPQGENPMGAAKFATELVSNILACLVAAFIVSFVAAGFTMRVLIGLLCGLVGWLSIDASYWNWYRFPGKWSEPS